MLRSTEIALILDIYESGKSQSVVARETGLSRRTVCKYLKLLGVSRHTSAYQPKKYNISEIVELYELGASCCDIALEFQISYRTVSKVLKQRNILIRRRNSKIDESVIRKFLKLHHEDRLPISTIAARFGLPWSSVKYHLKHSKNRAGRIQPLQAQSD